MAFEDSWNTAEDMEDYSRITDRVIKITTQAHTDQVVILFLSRLTFQGQYVKDPDLLVAQSCEVPNLSIQHVPQNGYIFMHYRNLQQPALIVTRCH